MSEHNDSSRTQFNNSHTDTEPRFNITRVYPRIKETQTFLPEQTPRGMTHDRLARRAQRIIRAYLMVGSLVLAGSVVATEHYKPDLKQIQRHVIDQVVNHTTDYATTLKFETLKEFDKLGPGQRSVEAPGPFVGSDSLSSLTKI